MRTKVFSRKYICGDYRLINIINGEKAMERDVINKEND